MNSETEVCLAKDHPIIALFEGLPLRGYGIRLPDLKLIGLLNCLSVRLKYHLTGSCKGAIFPIFDGKIPHFEQFIQSLLKNGFIHDGKTVKLHNVRKQNSFENVLALACRAKNKEVIDLLLGDEECKTLVYKCDTIGDLPIHKSVMANDLKTTIKLLDEYPESINKGDGNNNQDPFMLACYYNKLDIALELIERLPADYNFEKRDDFRHTLLHIAIHNHEETPDISIHLFKLFMEKDFGKKLLADEKSISQYGNVLHVAAMTNCVRIFETILQYDVDGTLFEQKRVHFNRNVLHTSCMFNCEKIVECILKDERASRLINEKNSLRQTPYDIARRLNGEIAKLISNHPDFR